MEKREYGKEMYLFFENSSPVYVCGDKNDLTVWFEGLTSKEANKLSSLMGTPEYDKEKKKIFSERETEGCSVRGSLKEVLEDIIDIEIRVAILWKYDTKTKGFERD